MAENRCRCRTLTASGFHMLCFYLDPDCTTFVDPLLPASHEMLFLLLDTGFLINLSIDCMLDAVSTGHSMVHVGAALTAATKGAHSKNECLSASHSARPQALQHASKLSLHASKLVQHARQANSA